MDTSELIDPREQRAAMDNDRALYRLSRLVDVLRDNAREMLGLYAAGLDAGQDTTLAEEMTDRYRRLRTEVAKVLPNEERAFFEEWTTPLHRSASVVELYEASASLARHIDTLIDLEAFVASRVKTRSEIGQVLKSAGVLDRPAARDTGSGQYL